MCVGIALCPGVVGSGGGWRCCACWRTFWCWSWDLGVEPVAPAAPKSSGQAARNIEQEARHGLGASRHRCSLRVQLQANDTYSPLREITAIASRDIMLYEASYSSVKGALARTYNIAPVYSWSQPGCPCSAEAVPPLRGPSASPAERLTFQCTPSLNQKPKERQNDQGTGGWDHIPVHILRIPRPAWVPGRMSLPREDQSAAQLG